MTGRQVRETCVLGTITKRQGIGRAIREARAGHADPVRAVLDVTAGSLIWRGKVADVARRTERGFVRGEARIVGDSGEPTIGFQNEFLIARVNCETLVTTPDLITILDAESGVPITTEGLRYGFRVVVLAIPSDPHLRTAAGLAVVGPRYFGYDADWSPVEARFGT